MFQGFFLNGLKPSGLFESSHMNFVLDNTEDNDTSNPSLAEMTETALRILQKNDKGFYLFVEGGQETLPLYQRCAEEGGKNAPLAQPPCPPP